MVRAPNAIHMHTNLKIKYTCEFYMAYNCLYVNILSLNASVFSYFSTSTYAYARSSFSQYRYYEILVQVLHDD